MCFECWHQNALVVQEVEYDTEVNAQYWSLRPVAVLARSLEIGAPLLARTLLICEACWPFLRLLLQPALFGPQDRCWVQALLLCLSSYWAIGTRRSLALLAVRDSDTPACPVAAQAWRFQAGF